MKGDDGILERPARAAFVRGAALASCVIFLGCGDPEPATSTDNPPVATDPAPNDEAPPDDDPEVPRAEAATASTDGEDGNSHAASAAEPGPGEGGDAAGREGPDGQEGSEGSEGSEGQARASELPVACERLDDEPRSVLPQRGPVGLARADEATDTFFLAGYHYDGETESIQVYEVSPERLRKVGAAPVEPAMSMGRHAAPAIDIIGGRPRVLFTDGRGRLWYSDLSRHQLVAPAADVRVPPVLARSGTGSVAVYADSGGDKPHVVAIPLDDAGAPGASHRLHPDYMGGTSPMRLRGEREGGRRIAFADPRGGFSNVLLSELDESGAPAPEPSVVTVVSQLQNPARVVVARQGDGARTHVGFTATDREGKTVVGYTVGGGGGNPQPLLQHRGYGLLDVDVVARVHSAVFVADSPLGVEDTASRELIVVQANERGIGPTLAIRGPDGTARAGRLVAMGDGTFYVAYTTLDAIHVERIRCSEAGTPPG